MTEKQQQVLLVTGMSGGGMTTALKALEDIGYEVVDNLPMALINSAVKNLGDRIHPLAIGIDSRTRDFSVENLENAIRRLKRRENINVELLFVDCQDNVLQNRFSETRRRHPMAIDRSIIDGISLERELLAPLIMEANDVIDTTELSVNDLRSLIKAKYKQDDSYGLTVLVTSFGFRNGLPRDADLVFDVRFLWNPHYDPDLKPLTGRDEKIQKRLEQEEGFQSFFDNLTNMLSDLLPRYKAEGKSYLNIGIGCTGGRHRSVFTAERLNEWLNKNDHHSSVRHRDLEKWLLQQKQRGDTFETSDNKGVSQ